MSCHHIWMQKAKDEISVVNGVTTTRYTHECPHCGKVKVTVRASRALPPELKWKRELEKLIQRAYEAGYSYHVGTDALATAAITIKPHA